VHVPIAAMSFLPFALGGPLLLYPVHVVFLEFVIDPACTLVYEGERADAGAMRQPPRDPGTPLFNLHMLGVSLALGAGMLVAVLAVFFQKTRIGRALRAVADDHQAALAVGIPLQHIWAIVWAVAGFVALVAGLMWGVRNGVQFALTFVALKALPVLLIGGFESIPGAIVGGLIIGATEKLAEVYVGPMVGGGIESWFAYVVALLFLLVRPEGLFGEKHIDRV